MKKAALIALLVSVAFNTWAQGLVKFANSATTLISYYGGTIPPSGRFYFALLCAPVGTSDLSQFVFAGVYATNTTATTGGRIQGGSLLGVTCNSNWPPATMRSFVVVGWSADMGAVWDPLWLTPTPCGNFGISVIATGQSGGTDPITQTTYPALALFSGVTIPWGFSIQPAWPHFSDLVVQPTNQSVTLGASVQMCAAGNGGCAQSIAWYFNGDLVSRTEGSASCYQIGSAQLANAGDYYAVGAGYDPSLTLIFRTSQVARLTVLLPPSIAIQPISQTAELGSEVRLQVSADGSLPLSFQWFFNAATAVGENNNRLVLRNVQDNQAGAYTVVITNAAGAVTSSPAMLALTPAVERHPAAALTLDGTEGQTINLETTSGFEAASGWLPLGTLMLTNSGQMWIDGLMPLPTQRFYRAWQNPAAPVAPSLRIDLVPSLVLTGAVGSSVRVDYINRFDSTIWQPLATVELTNTPQLYYDTSVIGQPPRLWRIVPVP